MFRIVLEYQGFKFYSEDIDTLAEAVRLVVDYGAEQSVYGPRVTSIEECIDGVWTLR